MFLFTLITKADILVMSDVTFLLNVTCSTTVSMEKMNKFVTALVIRLWLYQTPGISCCQPLLSIDRRLAGG